MTEDLIRRLMAAGLTKQQASSVTAETLINLFMPDDGKKLINEAQRQVEEMQSLVSSLRADYTAIKQKMDTVSETIIAINEAQNDHGSISDDGAKNVVALYAALLNMNEKAGATPTDAVQSASYVVYAYLGGQAKREISFSTDRKAIP